MKTAYVILGIVLICAVAFAYYSIKPVSLNTTMEAAEDDAEEALQQLQNNITDLSVETSVTPTGTIDLQGRGLTSVPAKIFAAKNVTKLDVSHNSLTGSLPAEVHMLSGLKVLDLSDNQFTGVPAEVGELSSLEILDLSNNPITALPHELGNLQSLKVLDLRGTSYAQDDLALIQENLPVNVEIKTE